MKPFKAIAAMSTNRVIGNKGGMPWHLPADLALFKTLTTNGAVVVGRRTWDSINRELPGRLMVILTSQPMPIPPGSVLVTPSLDIMRAFAMDFDDKQFWIAGGARLYDEMLEECSDLHLTRVHRDFEGDTFMPPFEHLFTLQNFIRSTRGGDAPDFSFEHWKRKPDVRVIEKHAAYSILQADGIKGIICFRCVRTSWNPNDVEQKYCGHCHKHHVT
jgi:dihydrofolate reductase